MITGGTIVVFFVEANRALPNGPERRSKGTMEIAPPVGSDDEMGVFAPRLKVTDFGVVDPLAGYLAAFLTEAGCWIVDCLLVPTVGVVFEIWMVGILLAARSVGPFFMAGLEESVSSPDDDSSELGGGSLVPGGAMLIWRFLSARDICLPGFNS